MAKGVPGSVCFENTGGEPRTGDYHTRTLGGVVGDTAVGAGRAEFEPRLQLHQLCDRN